MDPVNLSNFELLPDELLDDVLGRISRHDQCHVAATSKRCYNLAIPHLYRSIELVDCRGPGNGPDEYDDHDDTPMIRMIMLLATNEYLASKVQTLMHRCHLPLPGAFATLPYLHMTGKTLSCNVKVRVVLRAAIANMKRVRTLRIIFGHAHITNTLLHGFFDPKRTKIAPVRRLWIESSHLCGGRPHLDFNGLESLRLRRLRLGRGEHLLPDRFVLSRGGTNITIPDWGQGTTVTRATAQQIWYDRFKESFEYANKWDDAILKQFPQFDSLYEANKPAEISEWGPIDPPIDESDGRLCYTMIPSSAPTLVSLCLDWCFGMSGFFRESEILGSITFPKLRALQVRNAAMPETIFRDGSFLFEGFWLDFLSRHPKIQCLAWPSEHFFSATPNNAETRQVIDNLGRELKVLRVDAFLLRKAEPLTDLSAKPVKAEARHRRRLFIQHFAAKLISLEILKIEGGVPKDETREMIKAVKRSPLKKLVLIGVSCPIAPPTPIDLLRCGPGFHAESDDPTSIWFGIDDAPRLQTIATHHASTITDLKFCGFYRAPNLYYSTALSGTVHFKHLHNLLSPLRHFHQLQHIALAWELDTDFEDAHRDAEVIAYWADAVSPRSTALTVANVEAESNPWRDVLEQVYAPPKLAKLLAESAGPHLSPIAKARPGGVIMDALFLMGTHEKQDIYHFEVAIGPSNDVLRYKGPRGEFEESKTREKLETRGWF
ncbi:MAG: hypothetical protein M1812_005661 [Candelaria pacifica]|nr:MAG: hypothetical protein M1812_005661 [Candelaria pacifica]